jgi:hypothetical protein
MIAKTVKNKKQPPAANRYINRLPAASESCLRGASGVVVSALLPELSGTGLACFLEELLEADTVLKSSAGDYKRSLLLQMHRRKIRWLANDFYSTSPRTSRKLSPEQTLKFLGSFKGTVSGRPA